MKRIALLLAVMFALASTPVLASTDAYRNPTNDVSVVIYQQPPGEFTNTCGTIMPVDFTYRAPAGQTTYRYTFTAWGGGTVTATVNGGGVATAIPQDETARPYTATITTPGGQQIDLTLHLWRGFCVKGQTLRVSGLVIEALP